MEWHKFGRIILAYRWLIIVLSVSSLISAILVTYLLPEKYVATTAILVRPHDQMRVASKGDSSQGDKELLNYPVSQMAPIDAPSKTYIKLIKSGTLIEEVVRVLHLDQKKRIPSDNALKELWEEFKEWGKEWAEWARDMFKYGRSIDVDPFSKEVANVDRGLSLAPTKDTYVFDINYEASDPREAADVANVAAELFISYIAKTDTAEASDTREFIAGRLREADNEVVRNRAALRKFKETHKTFMLPDEYSAKLNVIGDFEKELEKTEAKLSSRQEIYTPSHASVLSLMAEKDRLIRSLRNAKDEIKGNPEKEEELENLKLRVKVAGDRYELLSKGFEDARTREANRTSELRVVSKAAPPSYPSKPIKLYYGLAGLVTGMLFAIGLALFLEFQRPRLRSMEDVRVVLQLPILATIPRKDALL